MAFLMAVGVGLMKKGMLSQQGCRDLGAILLNVVIPCVIICQFQLRLRRISLRARTGVQGSGSDFIKCGDSMCYPEVLYDWVFI